MKKFAVAFLVLVISFSASGQYKKYIFGQPKMGSFFKIVIYSTDSTAAANAAFATFKMIDSLNEIYSDYLPESELNKLCRTSGSGKWIKASEPLFSILQKARHASEISCGSFDVTMGPLVRLWRTARREIRFPPKDSFKIAMEPVNYKYIELDTVHGSVRLKKPGMQIDLGGIAKGEAAQRSYQLLCRSGFPYSLVDAGGDIVAGKVPPQVDGWKIAINLPESEQLMNRQLLLENKAVATSGDIYKYFELNGTRYSHIIDPATGYALIKSRNVTVIADTGADADWLATACSILSIKKALKLIKKKPAAGVQIAVLKNNKPYFYRSPGFTAYFK